MEKIIKKLELAKNNLANIRSRKNLSALNTTESYGQYEFETLQIIGNTIPERWCPEVRLRTSIDDLPIVPVEKGGTGAADAGGARLNLGLGSISTQDFDDVNITGGSISVSGQFNTGFILLGGSYSTSKMSVRSSLMNFKSEESVQMFSVPIGYLFLIDLMEILTTEITNPSEAPSVRFGYDTELSAFYGPNKTMSNELGFRHIIESPQNAVTEGKNVTFGITSGSSAESHLGYGIISGYLVKVA
jgi:hypothetical protein